MTSPSHRLHILSDFQAHGLERVGLGVHADNAPALALYRSLGFR